MNQRSRHGRTTRSGEHGHIRYQGKGEGSGKCIRGGGKQGSLYVNGVLKLIKLKFNILRNYMSYAIIFFSMPM